MKNGAIPMFADLGIIKPSMEGIKIDMLIYELLIYSLISTFSCIFLPKIGTDG